MGKSKRLSQQNMKELTIYFSFFKSSLLILLITSLLGITGGYYLYSRQLTIYTVEQVYELNDENKTGDEKIALAEEVVGLLREDSVRNADVQNLYISRIAPFAVKVLLSSDNPQSNSENLSFVSRFLSERGRFLPIGLALEKTNFPTPILFILAGFVWGFFCGICISLMKTYLKQF